MPRLCGFRISNYHNKVRIVLLEKGIAFEEDDTLRPRQTDEYLDEAYPQKPLLPRDPWQRARVRELVTHMELYLELPARRTYGFVFFGRPVDEQVKRAVEKDLVKGVRALRALAKFAPYVAGPELTLADCAAFVHLPLVSLTTKLGYGRDFLEEVRELKPYLQMLGERPAFRQVNDDRKAAQAAAAQSAAQKK